MSKNYKPFKDLSQMIKQPSSKHWFARHELTKKEGFNSSKFYGKKSKLKALEKYK